MVAESRPDLRTAADNPLAGFSPVGPGKRGGRPPTQVPFVRITTTCRLYFGAPAAASLVGQRVQVLVDDQERRFVLGFGAEGTAKFLPCRQISCLPLIHVLARAGFGPGARFDGKEVAPNTFLFEIR